MSRDLILVAYSACVLTGILIALTSARHPHRIMPLNKFLDRILWTRSTRFALLIWWWWIGIHYLGG